MHFQKRQGLTEYIVLLALVAIALILAIAIFGSNQKAMNQAANGTFKDGRKFTEMANAGAFDDTAENGRHRTGLLKGEAGGGSPSSGGSRGNTGDPKQAVSWKQQQEQKKQQAVKAISQSGTNTPSSQQALQDYYNTYNDPQQVEQKKNYDAWYSSGGNTTSSSSSGTGSSGGSSGSGSSGASSSAGSSGASSSAGSSGASSSAGSSGSTSGAGSSGGASGAGSSGGASGAGSSSSPSGAGGTVVRALSASPSTSSPSAGQTVTVTASALNVRTGAGTGNAVLTSVTEGTPLTIISSKDGWHQVRLSDGSTGWVSGDYVRPAQTGTVTASALNVRTGAGTGNSVITTISKGTPLTILESKNGWNKVRLPDGRTGWVSGKYVSSGGSGSGSGGGSSGGSSGGSAGSGGNSGSIDYSAVPNPYREWMPYVMEASKKYGVPPEIILAVISRETNGRNIRGDGGHGRGLMQIDDRWHQSWLRSHQEGMDPRSNIDYGTSILAANYRKYGSWKPALAAYNSGQGNVDKALRQGIDVDSYTAHKDYGADTLKRRDYFKTFLKPSGSKAPSTASSSGTSTGTVTASALNVRTGAGTGNPVMKTISNGSKVTLLETKDGWHKVRLEDGTIGWVSGKYIKTSGSAPSTSGSTGSSGSTAPAKKTGTVTASNGLNVRTGPGTGNSVIKTLPTGTKVTILETKNGWHKVELAGGKTGWVHSGYVNTGSTTTGSGGGTKPPNESGYSGSYNGTTPAPSTTNTRAWTPVKPPITSTTGSRSVARYNDVLNQFAVGNNPRYARRNGNTYCNIFVWDATSAMGAEIPHWVNNSGKAVGQGEGWEMNANATNDWLRNHGASNGWRQVTAAEAQANANTGRPSVISWKNPGGIGHIGMIRPGEITSAGAALAQAGGKNFNNGHVRDGFGNAANSSTYWIHD